MASKEFKAWVEQIGVVKAADLISDHLVSNGKKGITYQSVQDWLKSDVPLLRILTVEAVSGVSRHDLNPEMYPREAA